MAPRPSLQPSTGASSARETIRSSPKTRTKKFEDEGASDSSTMQQSLHTTGSSIVPSTPSIYGGGGGYGMYGNTFGGGMYGMTPYYGGGMPQMGPLSGLNQFLFGVQNVIFSLSQAVQIVGMNTQAMQKLLETVTAMIENAMKTYTEMRALELAARDCESQEARKKRRRLKALRWAVVFAVTYTGYRLVRVAFQPRKPRLTTT